MQIASLIFFPFRSMTDLDQNSSTHSPRRKFSFRFPNLSHSTSHDKDGSSLTSGGGHNTLNHHQTGHYLSKERRNFSQEAKNVPDLQVSISSHPFGRSGSTNLCKSKFVVNFSDILMWGRKLISKTNLLLLVS